MTAIYKAYCRTYQFGFKILKKFLKIPLPKITEGKDCYLALPSAAKAAGIGAAFIVSTKQLIDLGYVKTLTDGLDALGIKYAVYGDVVPNPSIDNVEDGLVVYKALNADGIIAVGGGSAIDCAKIIAARAVHPNKPVKKMRGYLKLRRRLPYFFAVPTTAGTGSECTLAAVICDAKTHEKFPINDPKLVPNQAFLDPVLTCKLPRAITSTTGMDALTHAIESYIGRCNDSFTTKKAVDATREIYKNITTAYDKGDGLSARQAMLRASYDAGAAFTRAFVGYVHAIAHAVGGLYNVPHGLANAVILPYILKAYGEAAHKKLAELAVVADIADTSDTVEVKANKLIDSIFSLNDYMGIPRKLKDIKSADHDIILKRALKEAHPVYPVPKLLSYEELKTVLDEITE